MIVRIGKTLYEVLHEGCATQTPDCPNGEHALTAYELDKDGRSRWEFLTRCIDARKAQEVAPYCVDDDGEHLVDYSDVDYLQAQGHTIVYRTAEEVT